MFDQFSQFYSYLSSKSYFPIPICCQRTQGSRGAIVMGTVAMPALRTLSASLKSIAKVDWAFLDRLHIQSLSD